MGLADQLFEKETLVYTDLRGVLGERPYGMKKQFVQFVQAGMVTEEATSDAKSETSETSSAKTPLSPAKLRKRLRRLSVLQEVCNPMGNRHRKRLLKRRVREQDKGRCSWFALFSFSAMPSPTWESFFSSALEKGGLRHSTLRWQDSPGYSTSRLRR